MGWYIEIYATETGDEPVMDFLKSLSKKHRAKALWEIDLLEQHGTSLKKPYMKPIKGQKYKDLMELRIQQGNDISRIFYFISVGKKIILLHGFVKKDRKTPKKELATALRYKEDYLRRYCRND